MPGVLIKLPVCFDIGLFFNCSGVGGRKATAGFFPFTGLMSTMGSVLIKSCRNIFTTVQRKWGYLVKLVSLHSEDLWGGAKLEMFAQGELFLDSASPYIQPRWPVCFPSLSVLSGEVFPQPPGRGKAMKGTVSCGSCFLCQCSYLPFWTDPCQSTLNSER